MTLPPPTSTFLLNQTLWYSYLLTNRSERQQTKLLRYQWVSEACQILRPIRHDLRGSDVSSFRFLLYVNEEYNVATSVTHA